MRDRIAEEPRRLLRIGRHNPRYPQVLRQDGLEHLLPVGCRSIEKVTPVVVKHVENEQRDRNRCLQSSDVESAARARGSLLKRSRSPGVVERDCLTVENHVADGEGVHRFDKLRYAGGDVVKSSGEHPHVVAGPMQLNPYPVQLPFQSHRAALRVLRQCSHDIGCRLRQHRQDRPPNLKTNGAQGLHAIAKCRRGDRWQRPTQHERASHVGHGNVGSRRDRLDHDTVLGTLPQLTAHECDQKRTFGFGSCGEQHCKLGRPPGLRARARIGGNAGERGIDGGQRKRRVGRRGVSFGMLTDVSERRPADTGASLAQLPGKERRSDLNFIGSPGVGRPKTAGDKGDLRRS